MTATSERNWKWLVWVVALLAFAGDQMTKTVVRTTLSLGESRHFFDTFPLNQIAITRTFNTGAAFGMLSDYGTFFIIVAIVVIAGIGLYYRRLPKGQWWLFLSLGLQVGGAAGNLVDRLRFGHVTDFIQIGIFPIFNLADVAIVSGVGILAIHFWREDQRVPEEEAEEPARRAPHVSADHRSEITSWTPDRSTSPNE